MSALDRLAPLATTGVGSLPVIDVVAGARHAVRAYDVPFCPQLPAREGDMVREWLGADPWRCGWNEGRDRERPAAWEAFLAELDRRPGRAAAGTRVAKLQVTGPLTLAVALERSAGRVGPAPDARTLARELSAWLAANVAGQVRTLAEHGYATLLIVDEPGLDRAGIDPREIGVWDPLRSCGAAGWGLHVCGAVPWPVVCAARPDVLSFDVVRHGIDGEARAGLLGLLGGGARIAWGVLDPVAPGDAGTVAGRASACVAALAVGRSAEEVAARSLLTPSCGTGRLSKTRERLVAAILAAAAMATRDALSSVSRVQAP